MKAHVAVACWLAALLTTGAFAEAQSLDLPTTAFRVEWERRTGAFWRPAVEGYVYNDSEFRVGNVRLRIEVVDGAGHPLEARNAWVAGAIDARGRGYFVLPPPAVGQDYRRITVDSFDLLARQGPPGGDMQAP